MRPRRTSLSTRSCGPGLQRFRRINLHPSSDYRGKVVLLNFWWSECEPCIVELPSLLELHRDQPDLAILAISIDEDPDSYSRFLVRRHVDLITVRDPTECCQALPYRAVARDLRHRPQRHHPPQIHRRAGLVQPRDSRLPQELVIWEQGCTDSNQGLLLLSFFYDHRGNPLSLRNSAH